MPTSDATSNPNAHTIGIGPIATDVLRHAGTSSPPPVRPIEVRRSALIGALTRFAGRVALLSAPAGYGKSMTAAQWCRDDPRPVIWLEMGARDDDPITLGGRILVALHSIAPLDEQATDALVGSPSRLERVLLPSIERSIAARAPIILAIDDAHHLRSPGAIALLRTLIDCIPTGSLMVLTAREDPPLALHRLRTDGDLLEIRLAELAMDEEAIGAVLAKAGATPTPADLEAVARTTEGWPAGVGLVGLRSAEPLAGGRVAVPDARSALPSDFASYFLDEVMSELAPELLEFIRQSAVLTEFSPALCDAALERSDSAARLRQIERSNAFLIPLDDGHHRFRYHHLFSDFLNGEQYVVDADTQASILRRAAKWHVANGTPDEALVAAQSSGDQALFGEIAARYVISYFATGRVNSLKTILERCSDNVIASDFNLSLVAANLYSRVDQPARARAFLDAASRANKLDDPASDGATERRSQLLVTRNAVWQTDVYEMLTEGQQLIELTESLRWSPLRASGFRIAGCALLYQGRTAEAIAYLERGKDIASGFSDAPNSNLLISGYLVCALLDNQRIEDAANLWDDLDASIGRFRTSYPLDALATFIAETHIAAFRNEPTAARAALRSAYRSLGEFNILPVMFADLAVRAAELAIGLDERELATGSVAIAKRALAQIVEPGQIAERCAAVMRTLDTTMVTLERLSPAERRVLGKLKGHRTLEEIAGELFVSRSTVKTHVRMIYMKLGVSTRSEAVALLESAIPDGMDLPMH